MRLAPSPGVLFMHVKNRQLPENDHLSIHPVNWIQI